MARHVRLRELLVGIEGLALLRHLYDGADEDATRRLIEVAGLLDDDRFDVAERTSETEPRAGYRAWSESYDQPGNPIVALEQAAVDAIFDTLPPGRALDAACGTGRHAARLATLGHDVLGIDITPEMLARAAINVPSARFVEADLREVPAPDEQFDLVVCALALAHLPGLDRAVRELGRVLKHGGRLVVSVLHPFQALLGWQAPFADPDGARRFVREHPHGHADYLAAFRAAGLDVLDCIEPTLNADHLATKRRAFEHIPDATRAAYLGLPAVLVWDTERV
jgi:SAM-dependent methyltransferase